MTRLCQRTGLLKYTAFVGCLLSWVEVGLLRQGCHMHCLTTQQGWGIAAKPCIIQEGFRVSVGQQGFDTTLVGSASFVLCYVSCAPEYMLLSYFYNKITPEN